MAVFKPDHKDYPVLGAGRIYFQQEGEEHERYLGDTPELSLTMTSETVDLFSSDGPVAELRASVLTQIERTGNFTCNNIDPENIALFFAGKYEDDTQSTISSTQETFEDTVPGGIYRLGVSPSSPYGVVDVTVTGVSDETGSPSPLSEGDDYIVDEEYGAVQLLKGGVTEIEVTYTGGPATVHTVKTTDQVKLRGSLLFIADNSYGENWNVFMPSVELAPDGDFSMKSRTDFQEVGFAISISTPDDGREAIYYYKKGA